jgi:hypothetical protein
VRFAAALYAVEDFLPPIILPFVAAVAVSLE